MPITVQEMFAPLGVTWPSPGDTQVPAEQAWKVGMIFSTVLATPAAELIGYGTWAALAPGQVLIGHDPNDVTFTAGNTGGTKAVALTANEMPAHSHVQDSHNHTQNSHTHVQDAHSHTIPVGATDDTSAPFDRADAGSNTAGANATTATGTAVAVNQAATALNQAVTAVNQATGGGAAHNNLQPYLVVYRYVRTA